MRNIFASDSFLTHAFHQVLQILVLEMNTNARTFEPFRELPSKVVVVCFLQPALVNDVAPSRYFEHFKQRIDNLLRGNRIVPGSFR